MNTRTLATAALATLLAACGPCGGSEQVSEVREGSASGSADSSAAAEGSAAASSDAPTAAVPQPLELRQVAALPPVGALAAGDVHDGVVARVVNDVLTLDRLDADGSTARIAEQPLEGPGDLVRVELQLPWAAALRVDRPEAPDQPALSGTLETVFFGGLPRATTRSLPGAPVDLWIADPPTHAWVLVRRGREGELLRYELGAEAADAPDVRLGVSTSPVALYPSDDGSVLLVPCFDGRAVHVVDVASGTELHRVGVDVRPTTAWLTGDTLTVAAPNAAQARVVDLAHGSDGQVAPLPFVPTAWTHGPAGVFATAAGPGAVVRLEAPWLEVVASREALGPEAQVIPMALRAIGELLWIADGAPAAPALWVLDAETLAVRGRVALEGAPSVVDVAGEDLVTLSPVTGAAARWRAVLPR